MKHISKQVQDITDKIAEANFKVTQHFTGPIYADYYDMQLATSAGPITMPHHFNFEWVGLMRDPVEPAYYDNVDGLKEGGDPN